MNEEGLVAPDHYGGERAAVPGTPETGAPRAPVRREHPVLPCLHPWTPLPPPEPDSQEGAPSGPLQYRRRSPAPAPAHLRGSTAARCSCSEGRRCSGGLVRLLQAAHPRGPVAPWRQSLLLAHQTSHRRAGGGGGGEMLQPEPCSTIAASGRASPSPATEASSGFFPRMKPNIPRPLDPSAVASLRSFGGAEPSPNSFFIGEPFGGGAPCSSGSAAAALSGADAFFPNKPPKSPAFLAAGWAPSAPVAPSCSCSSPSAPGAPGPGGGCEAGKGC